MLLDSAKLVLDTALDSSSALRCSICAAEALGRSRGVGDRGCSAGAAVDSFPQPALSASAHDEPADARNSSSRDEASAAR